jgi:carbon-monoxide dehydrogenase medium subunit
MIPARFDYEPAVSVEQAIELLRSDDEAKLLAGGQSLLPMMKLRFARPSLLVDIGRLPGLSYVRDDGDGLAIGALTRHHDLTRDPLLQEHCRVLAEAAKVIADPQVRHLGTIGGSAAHADAAADLPAVLLALDAELVARGAEGERRIPARDFFAGIFQTALGPHEVLTEIRVPKTTGGVYLKFTRRASDWATVGVAAVRDGASVRIGLANMGSTPLRAAAVEEALADGAAPGEAAARAADGTAPPSDTSGSADYRRHLAQVLVRRALTAVGR